MRHLSVMLISGMVTSVVTLAEESAPWKATAPAPRCDTTFDGAVNGDVRHPDKWTNGLPGPTRAACFPDDVKVAQAAGTRQTVPMSGLFARAKARGSGMTSPTANGSCCLGSTCQQTDAFDCRELGGYFLEGVGPCSELVCATGACCTDDTVCNDDGGGGMNEALCGILNGNYLGGAPCDYTDPCQRFRLPQGFEYIELTPGHDAFEHGRPRLNNCGESVFHTTTPAATAT